MASKAEVAIISEAERPKRAVFRRNLEGVRLEKLRTLKVSRSAYRGVMNGVRDHIEELVIDPGNKEAVKVEKSSFDKTFINCSKCCQDFKDNLCSGEEIEHRQVAQEYNNVNERRT
jgi:hypothetical protein